MTTTATTTKTSRYHGRKFGPVATLQTICSGCGQPAHLAAVVPNILTTGTDAVALQHPHPTVKVWVHSDGYPVCRPVATATAS